MLRIVTIALLLVCGSAYASEPTIPNPQSTQADQHTKQQHRITNNTPLSVTVKGPVTIEGTHKERAEERQESDKEASSEVWLVRFTGALTLATIALAISTGLLWCETKKTAKAANAGVELARDEFNATHRPWLSPSIKASGDMAIAGDNVSIVITIEMLNSGNTPAIDARWTAKILARREVSPENWIRSEFEGDTIPYRGPQAYQGDVIFPSERAKIEEVQIQMSTRELEIARQESAKYPGWENCISLVLAGGVSYQSAITGNFHQSIVVYDLFFINPDNPDANSGIPTNRGMISSSSLRIKKCFGVGGYAT